jgi:hypothetical protein
LAQAQTQSLSGGIYTCVDAKGRKITSDRPIPECSDREQVELNPSGTVKSRVGPTLTAQELIEAEARRKREIEEKARVGEERRRERALLTRYPSKEVHDKERALALAQIGIVKQAAVTRVDELLRQRKLVEDEMLFYQKDPSKAPGTLRRQAEEVAQSLAVQGRFIADQDGEVQRVTARFDEELMRLRLLWAAQAGAGSSTGTAPGKTK